MKKILFILVTTVILLNSCSVQKRCERHQNKVNQFCNIKNNVEVRDSIITKIEVRYRDTTIYVPLPKDTVRIETIVKANRNGIINLDTIVEENGIIRVIAWINNSKLGIQGEVADSSVWIELKNTIKERDIWRERYRSDKSIKTIKKQFIPKIYAFYAWFFWIIIIVGIIYISFKNKELLLGWWGIILKIIKNF